MDLYMEWTDIQVVVKEKVNNSFFKNTKRKKIILDNVSGWANSGSLIAILGPSGSGKTTFLEAVSGRLEGKTGTVKINGRIVKDNEISNISGFVKQDDIFTESLTVFEHMQFVTYLRLNKPKEEVKAKIDKILIDLSLDASKNTIIRMLSGGEKRRLSLATELISDPLILFCDEPTTGLDSFNAMMVVQKLEEVSKAGKLVLVTVHQPSSQIFALFNNIMLMTNGHLIFEGTKQDAKNLFEWVNLSCPATYNLSDFFITQLTITPGSNEESEKTIYKLKDAYDQRLAKSLDSLENNFMFDSVVYKGYKKKGFFFQLKWLLWRVYLDSIRSMSRFWTAYILCMITSLIISITFSKVDLKDKNSVQNIQGALVLLSTELIFSHMYYVFYVFPSEVAIFVNEKSLYSASPYFISKFISVVPVCFINSGCFLSLYFIVMRFLNGFELFIFLFLVVFVTCMCAVALGLCLSALFPSVEYIDLFSVPLELIVMILSGIWIKIDTVPQIFRAIKYISPFFFSFQAVSTLYWENLTDLGGNCSYIDPPCFTSGKEVLDSYGMLSESNVVVNNVLFMIGLLLIYSYIGFLGIIRKRSQYRV